ncbi:MAG: hypothetical protein EHM50_08470 [Lysobacterales bacterium]|nr:MAG: hypothetical protein EHM50_08470 [Xanthomonadales bacterium]
MRVVTGYCSALPPSTVESPGVPTPVEPTNSEPSFVSVTCVPAARFVRSRAWKPRMRISVPGGSESRF